MPIDSPNPRKTVHWVQNIKVNSSITVIQYFQFGSDEAWDTYLGA